jgi:hypothetical protein
MTTSANEPVPGAPVLPASRRDRRTQHETQREDERPIPSAIEPASRAARVQPSRTIPVPPPRWSEPELDYRSPTPIERARLLRAAYDACAADGEQRLLLAELMAHYRAWCLRNGKGDPFAGLSRD